MVSRSAPPLIVHVVHSLEGGGTEHVLASLLRAFDHRQLRHAVVALRDAGSLAASLPEEVACIALNTAGRSRLAFLRLSIVFARLRPAVIHARNVCTWSDAVLARMRTPGARLVLGFHGLESGGNFLRRDRLIAKVARASGARFSSVSQHAREKMSKELGLSRAPITHLPNGIDLDRFQPPTPQQRTVARQTLGIAPDDWALGVVGSLTPVKGHDLLLAALALARQAAPNIKLFIVGDGPIRLSLVAHADRLAISDFVRFIGRREDIPTVLHALDAYVCPSHSEGTSNALLEAMASGLPVVSTAVGDHPVMIRDGVDGLNIPPNDAVALAHALEALCSSARLPSEMGMSARERAAQFSIGRTIESYQDFYHELCPKPSPKVRSGARTCRGMSKNVIGALFARMGARPPLQ